MLQIPFSPFVILLINSYVQGSQSNDTLPTTSGTSPVSSKLTKIDRTLKQNHNDDSRTSNAFQGIDGRRKNTNSYIWKWDHWCQLQPKRGNCEKSLMRYYYDVKIDECSTFNYSGCDGNQNNFDTLLDCQRHCKGANYMKVEDFRQPAFCHLQPEAGLCLAILMKYYYDVNEKTCKQFIYGGCGGNLNKFDTLLSCMKTCSGK